MKTFKGLCAGILLAFAMVLMLVLAAPHANGQTTDAQNVIACDWTQGFNFVQGGSVNPPGTYAVYHCPPVDKYSNPQRVTAVVRFDKISSTQQTNLQKAIQTHDIDLATAQRNMAIESADLRAVWLPDVDKINAAYPGPTWVVKANGAAAERPAYEFVPGSLALGKKSSLVAPVGMACACSDAQLRFESGTSLYCPFASSVADQRKGSYSFFTVALCGKR